MDPLVNLDWTDKGIVIVTMQDVTYKNTLSSELMSKLHNTFDEIKKNEAAKVIVLKGLDSYFCCGGTKSDLLKLAEGKMTFADMPIYRLLLDCELPVIAAMQGHALGGGLAFSAFADLLIMAEESTYASNFLKYGFTPGFGATYIIPKKFGPILGPELLYTAQEYEGRDLKARNTPIRIVKRNDVVMTAMNIANEMSEKPAISLKLLKQQLTKTIKDELPHYIEQELAMHKISFARPEVKEMIEKYFIE